VPPGQLDGFLRPYSRISRQSLTISKTPNNNAQSSLLGICETRQAVLIMEIVSEVLCFRVENLKLMESWNSGTLFFTRHFHLSAKMLKYPVIVYYIVFKATKVTRRRYSHTLYKPTQVISINKSACIKDDDVNM
jgi:hypothetical protein